MPSFAQLCADVITKTGRPELIAETQLAVRTATKFLHLRELYLRDSQEDLFTFTNPDFIFQFDTAQFERYRKIRYIKKYDLVQQATKETDADKISECGADNLFDRYNNRKTNIFYVAGNSLNLRSSTQESAFIISWYKYPTVDPNNYNSWIAELYDPAIIDYATAEVFEAIGRQDDANRLKQMVLQVHVPVIQTNDIEATGR